jgi:hypothetical protein
MARRSGRAKVCVPSPPKLVLSKVDETSIWFLGDMKKRAADLQQEKWGRGLLTGEGDQKVAAAKVTAQGCETYGNKISGLQHFGAVGV